MVRYPEPTRGASLLIALKPTRKPILVVGSGSLAASRIFSALEADADVLIASRGSIRHACEEVQWRVYHGDAEWLDATDAIQDDPDQQQTTFGALLDANPAIQLVCVTDTLNATEALPKRSAASAKAIARACRDRRIWVNVADMPSLCDFTFPATHRFALSSQSTDDPNLRTVDIKGSALQLAVTANGHGCRLASRLKREVVARLPRNVGDAVDNVGRLRLLARSEDEDPEALSSAMTMHDSGVQFFDEDDSSPINKPVPQRSHDESPAERCARRMRWVAQLSEYTPLEQLAAMDKAGMKEVLESRLPAKPSGTGKCGRGRSNSPLKSDPTKPPAEPETSIPSRHHLALDPPPRSDPTSGRIILVGSGPGHPALLTRAAHHAITNLATLVLADKLVPGEIMAIIPKHVEVKVAKKYPGNAEHAQDEFIQLAIQGARAGKCVIRLKQGDPYLYGRGGEELLAFQAAEPPLAHPPLVIPGISSALSAPLLSTIPVTQRNVADSLVICTAVGKGGKGGIVWGYERARSLVILMGVARLGELVRCLVTGSSEGAVIGGGGVAKRLVGGLSSTKPVPVVPVAPVPPPSTSAPAQSNSSRPTPTPISTTTTTSTPPPNSTLTPTPQPPSPNPNAPPTPITSPLTLSGPVYPPSTPIAIIERASMPDQRLIATSLDRIERALEREGSGRPPGMIIVGWAVVALAQSQVHSRTPSSPLPPPPPPSSSSSSAAPPRDGGILDIKGDGLGAYDETRDRERLERWLGGREYVTREGMEDGWEVFAGLA
ncbi:unnamed protein product [Rhizoctonia solani]|uniref:Tetrapyrrole methylase domain-containing protein n=1 Tax=Rhizoctonia solani TaxID=456999 RepID=A0A8H3A0N6_9AGAM|nr:unnamed protein product [Rhizoctonia solani]